MERVRIQDLAEKKRASKKISMVTAYDYPTAKLADEAGIDIILVGDTYGMVSLGYETTTPTTMDEMLTACKAASRAVTRALLVGDMPFMSFQASAEDAVRNAGRFVKEGGVDAVKLEGGQFADAVRAITKAGIPVMGHAALAPQTAPLWGGYSLQGKSAEQTLKLLGEAQALQAAGAFSLVLEMVAAEAAGLITQTLSIPCIGIGAGPSCDGQVLVLHDILGLYSSFTPKFAKKYRDLAGEIRSALSEYRQDIETGRFPGPEHVFHMQSEELEQLRRTKLHDASVRPTS